jgi:hypothetical protein
VRGVVRWLAWDVLGVAPFVAARPGDRLRLSDGREVVLTAVGDTTWAVEVDPATGRARPDRTEGVLHVRPARGSRGRVA